MLSIRETNLVNVSLEISTKSASTTKTTTLSLYIRRTVRMILTALTKIVRKIRAIQSMIIQTGKIMTLRMRIMIVEKKAVKTMMMMQSMTAALTKIVRKIKETLETIKAFKMITLSITQSVTK